MCCLAHLVINVCLRAYLYNILLTFLTEKELDRNHPKMQDDTLQQACTETNTPEKNTEDEKPVPAKRQKKKKQKLESLPDRTDMPGTSGESIEERKLTVKGRILYLSRKGKLEEFYFLLTSHLGTIKKRLQRAISRVDIIIAYFGSEYWSSG